MNTSKSWALVFVFAGLGACALPSCLDQGSPSPTETKGASTNESLVVGPLVGPEDETEYAVLTQPLKLGVLKRSFPATALSEERRASAFAQLRAMRAAQGLTHQDPDAPSFDTCGGRCGDAETCISGFCARHCGGGEFPCAAGTEQTDIGEDCFCLPIGGPGDAGGTGGPGAVGCGWLPAGPSNIPGRVTSLAFDPGDGNRLFAGTVGGLWSSSDKGRRWGRLLIGTTGSSAAASRVVGDLTFNAASRELFVAMSDVQYSSSGDGLWLSPDGASGNFTKISDATVDGRLIKRAVADPTAGGGVYLATSGGLYRGTRSGATWTFSVLDSMTATLDDAVVDFSTSPPLVYVAVLFSDGTHGPGVWRHDAGGWTLRNTNIALTTPMTSLARFKLALAKSSPQTLYTKVALLDSSVDPAVYRVAVYKTTDGGGNWTASANAPTVIDASYPWYNALIGVDPANANNVYVGGVDLYRSTDGGTAWKNISDGADPAFSLTIHADQHAIAFDPANANLVYSGNDGGVYRSTDASQATWHWNFRAHGLLSGEQYRIASQRAIAGLIATGAQDNGTQITFGNQTWYQPGGCDGADVAVDSANASTLYGHCNGRYIEFTNPVPYSPSGDSTVAPVLPVGVSLRTTAIGVPIIVATDPTTGSVALVRGVTGTAPAQQEVVLLTTDSLNYKTVLTLPVGQTVSAMNISAASPKRYYVAVTGDPSGAVVFTSPDSGVTFPKASTGTFTQINAIASDPSNSARAWAATSSGTIFQTTDSGGSWPTLTATDAAHAFPGSASATGIAAAATGSGRLYASADVGVFQGDLDGTGKVSWAPFDDGLPDGIDVSDVSFNPTSSTLIIGTKGNGAFRRDVSLVGCSTPQLIVRDSVFDHGQSPTPSGLPNPESPVADPGRPGFFKPDDSVGGQVYFWESTDIRTAVPSATCKTSATEAVDHVEFESCPSNVASCPPWLLTDTDPVRGQLANVFMQVGNQSAAPAHNVRVVAMYADASAGVPALPANFWVLTAVPGASTCGALDGSTGWHLLGCNVIPTVSVATPEVATFPWNVPAAAAEHSCVLSIVDSGDDPITGTSTDVEAMTVNNRHVAHRNLHLIDGPSAVPCTGGPNAGGSPEPGIPFSGLTTVFVPNRWNTSGVHDVLLSRSGMESSGRLSFLLPTGESPPGLLPQCGVAKNSSSDAVAISLPMGAVADSFALSANGSISIDERVSVLDEAGAGAAVGNAGTGTVRLDDNSKIGGITAAGDVHLEERSTVLGGVTFGGKLTRERGANVTGASARSTTLTPADVFSWVAAFPPTAGASIDVERHRTVTLPPGNYDEVEVDSDATLKLSTGTYFMDSLSLEGDSKVELDQAAGPVIIYVRRDLDIRGLVKSATGQSVADPLFVLLGSSAVTVENTFSGTIVAPNSKIVLGSKSGRSTTMTGAFHGRDIEVRRGTAIRLHLSRAWSTLPACRALSAVERSKATSAGLSTKQYPVSERELTQHWPIPFGQRWLIGVRYDSGSGRSGTGSRFRVISLSQGQVKGGNTFVLRQ